MLRKFAFLGITISLTITLAGCMGKSEETSKTTPDSGAVSSSVREEPRQIPRPSAPLGVYSALFLSEGAFLPVRSAVSGIQAGAAIIKNQQDALKDEGFALLQELGGVLQINLVDTLNRSENRIQTLDQYSESLKNLIARGDRQVIELDAALQDLRQKDSKQSGEVNTVQQRVSKALSSKDYATAGAAQQELTKAQGELAQTQLKQRQTTDLRQQFVNLLRTAKARQTAIDNNREALLSGIAITDDPALKDLGIINPSSKANANPWSF